MLIYWHFRFWYSSICILLDPDILIFCGVLYICWYPDIPYVCYEDSSMKQFSDILLFWYSICLVFGLFDSSVLLTFWSFGIMKPLYYDRLGFTTLMFWYSGILGCGHFHTCIFGHLSFVGELILWYLDTVKFWYFDIEVSWCFDSLILWCSGVTIFW